MSLEVVRHDHEAWAFTVKKLRSPSLADEAHYTKVLLHLSKFGFVKTCRSERDPKGVLHIHGIIMLRKGMLRKKLVVQGFHMKLELIYDEHGWEDYIMKDQKDRPDAPARAFRDVNLFQA